MIIKEAKILPFAITINLFWEKQSSRGAQLERCLKFRKIHRKNTCVPESVAGRVCNFFKKETDIFKSINFEEHLQTTSILRVHPDCFQIYIISQ